jgi:hypothetical protein
VKLLSAIGLGATALAACGGTLAIDTPTSADAGGGSTSSGGSTNDNGPRSCRRSVPGDCAPTELCTVTGCADTGVCSARPAQENHYRPVCGCDDVTYWNETIANAAGVSKKSDAQCTGGKNCRWGGPENHCTDKERCVHEFISFPGALCPPGAYRIGGCWGLPDVCPVADTSVVTCGGLQCSTRCASMKDNGTFYIDTTQCP